MNQTSLDLHKQFHLTHLILQFLINIHISFICILILILSRNFVHTWHGPITYQMLFIAHLLSTWKKFLGPAVPIEFLSQTLNNTNPFLFILYFLKIYYENLPWQISTIILTSTLPVEFLIWNQTRVIPSCRTIFLWDLLNS